ncbi:hypothetical protein [Methylobacterium sp. E-016]|uniref:hypothetical protein n=1 Tax=Methylobacterium sp. E-016 TaxID=2836556 RepID=UPI001FB8C1A4|nr:hypothetical protein [Methylobacterium sp. E-016]
MPDIIDPYAYPPRGLDLLLPLATSASIRARSWPRGQQEAPAADEMNLFRWSRFS